MSRRPERHGHDHDYGHAQAGDSADTQATLIRISQALAERFGSDHAKVSIERSPCGDDCSIRECSGLPETVSIRTNPARKQD